ncbi:MAG: choice-of-anchor I family protein [Bacteroidota bacterium]
MRNTTIAFCLLVFVACKKTDTYPVEPIVNEDPSSYSAITSLNLGGADAAEITTYDPATKRLFAVNNGSTNKIDVINMADPAAITVIHAISMAPYGGYVNSVDISNGKLAAAIESVNKQESGKVVVFNTGTYAEEKIITVGALPDMVVYSPNGKFILTANEGEPNTTYSTDPEGSISIISVENNYAVTTLNFSAFTSQQTTLKAKGLRISGLNKNFLNDIEPEYITVSSDSKTAWVTLQEANAIAGIDLISKTITSIMPLGYKDFNQTANATDVSDRDNSIAFTPWKIFGIYMPDAIANLSYNGKTYLFTANEGDSREYTAFTDFKRLSAVNLDATAFPNATTLKTDAQLGRLNILTTDGDTDNDGDYDAIYSMGARSFSVWDASNGSLVFDSKNELDVRAKDLAVYDDRRSDDKSVEPEAITLGKVGNKQIAFVGLERADAIAIYDVSIPTAPVFLKMIKTGDAPEGILFIPASKSPINQSLLVVSSENDGVVKVYKATKL